MKKVLIALGSVVILAFSGCGASGTVSSPGVSQDVVGDGSEAALDNNGYVDSKGIPVNYGDFPKLSGQ